jgi:hypothetical protein
VKEIVIASADAFENVRQSRLFRFTQFIQPGQVPFADYHDLEGPDGPEWHQSGEAIVFTHQPLSGFQLQLEIAAK